MKPARHLAFALLALLLFAAAACSSDDSDDSSSTTAAGAGTHHSDASEEDLATWQTDLNAVGCWAGPADGIDGPKTEAAIKEYQAAKGLTVDGLLGPQTEEALREDVAAGNTVCTGGGSTTTTTSGDCPPDCAPNLSVEPTSGPVGTDVTLTTSGDECQDTVTFAEGSPEEATVPGDWSPGAGSADLTYTIPAGLTAGETYTFTAECGATAEFTVG